MSSIVEEIKIDIKDTYYNVIKFGYGKRNLVIIAGMSLTGLENKGEQISNAYKLFCKDYTVYLFERIKTLPENYSTFDMASDVIAVTDILKLDKFDLYGISHGGMIAEVLASKYPQRINKLVLCSTVFSADECFKKVSEKWIELCGMEDAVMLNRNFFDVVYSKKFLNGVKDILPVLEKEGTKADMHRFSILSKACVSFNGVTGDIKTPSLVIGDENDRVFSIESIKLLASKLHAKLIITKDYSHAVYDEYDGLKGEIFNFLKD